MSSTQLETSYSAKGWPWTTIGQIARTSSGGTPSRSNPTYFGGEIPWVKSGDLENGPVLASSEFITASGLANSSAKIFPEGTILLAMYGATVGKLGILGLKASTNQAICGLNFEPSVDTMFAFSYLRYIKGDLIDRAKGGAQPNISQEIIRETPFPVPSLEEQIAIVSHLAKAEEQLDLASDRLAKVPALLKKFRQSVLAAACSGQLTANYRPEEVSSAKLALGGLVEVPISWQVVPISQVTKTLDQGWSPKCHEHPRREPNLWAVLKTSSIEPMNFVWQAHKELPTSLQPREALEARAGDLLITRAGPRSRCAVCSLVRETPHRLMICDKMYRLRLDGMLPSFLEIVLNSPSSVELLDDMKTGISDSGLNLTQKGLLAIEVPLPTFEEQAEIVCRVESLFALADSIEFRLAEATARVDRTTQAILAKAFNGELCSEIVEVGQD